MVENSEEEGSDNVVAEGCIDVFNKFAQQRGHKRALCWHLIRTPYGEQFSAWINSHDGEEIIRSPLSQSFYTDYAHYPTMKIVYGLWMRYSRGPEDHYPPIHAHDRRVILALESDPWY